MKRTSVPWREVLPTFLVTAAIATGLIWRSELDALADARQSATRIAETHASAIRRNIYRALSATYPLAALIRSANGTPADFDELATELLPYYRGASALALAPDGVVRAIVPREGNEAALGLDLLSDPQRNKEAFRARDSRMLTLAGPFELVQGGLAVAGRLPVHLGPPGRDTFWGFVSVLIRFPEVLRAADLGQLNAAGYAYELWRTRPDTGRRQSIAAAGDLVATAVDVRLDVPNGAWVLSVAPAAGWHDPIRLALKGAVGLLICVLAGALKHSIVRLRREREAVERRIEERTSELAQSEQRFRDIAHISADWIWEVDAAGVFTYASESVRTLLGYDPGEIVGKTPFDLMAPDEAVRVGAAFGEIAAAKIPFQNLEKIVRRKNGEPCATLTNGTPILADDGALLGYRGVDRDITAQRKLEKQIRRLAFIDSLTQLPNRRLFADRLDQALASTHRQARFGALLFLDLDRFKPLNDAHGHAVGDLLLIEVADRLTHCVRETDTVARFGGDEFVVMLGALAADRAAAVADAAAVAANILESLSRPYHLRKHGDDGLERVIEHCCSASIGVALFRGHEATADVLMKHADGAMYAAKAAGRGAVRFAAPD